MDDRTILVDRGFVQVSDAVALDGAVPQVVQRIVGEASLGSGALTPLPVDTSAIPNDHLQYAITWFSLATVWTLMTIYFLSRRPAAKRS